jgi:hypothetical protein
MQIEEEAGARYRIGPKGGRIRLCDYLLPDKGIKCCVPAIKEQTMCSKHAGQMEKVTNRLDFKTGLYSVQRKRFSTVGSKLLERVNELRDDPELFSLKDDAAYITAIMDARAEAAAEGVSYEQYKKIKTIYKQASDAYGTEEFDDLFKSIGVALNSVMDEYQASKDVIELIDVRKDIVEAEQRILHAKAYTLEVDQAFSLVMQVVDVVLKNVHNPDEVQAIKSGVGKLMKVYENPEDVMDAIIVSEE